MDSQIGVRIGTQLLEVETVSFEVRFFLIIGAADDRLKLIIALVALLQLAYSTHIKSGARPQFIESPNYTYEDCRKSDRLRIFAEVRRM